MCYCVLLLHQRTAASVYCCRLVCCCVTVLTHYPRLLAYFTAVLTLLHCLSDPNALPYDHVSLQGTLQRSQPTDRRSRELAVHKPLLQSAHSPQNYQVLTEDLEERDDAPDALFARISKCEQMDECLADAENKYGKGAVEQMLHLWPTRTRGLTATLRARARPQMLSQAEQPAVVTKEPVPTAEGGALVSNAMGALVKSACKRQVSAHNKPQAGSRQRSSVGSTVSWVLSLNPSLLQIGCVLWLMTRVYTYTMLQSVYRICIYRARSSGSVLHRILIGTLSASSKRLKQVRR